MSANLREFRNGLPPQQHMSYFALVRTYAWTMVRHDVTLLSGSSLSGRILGIVRRQPGQIIGRSIPADSAWHIRGVFRPSFETNFDLAWRSRLRLFLNSRGLQSHQNCFRRVT